MAEDGADLVEQLRKAEIPYSKYLQAIEQREAELKSKSRQQRPTEYVDLDQADREQRARLKNHPAHGDKRKIPDGWTSTGVIKRPDR